MTEPTALLMAQTSVQHSLGLEALPSEDHPMVTRLLSWMTPEQQADDYRISLIGIERQTRERKAPPPPAIGWLIVRGRQVTLCRDRPSNDALAYLPGARLVTLTDPADLALSIDQLTAKHVVMAEAAVRDHSPDAGQMTEPQLDTLILAAVDRRVAKGSPMPSDAPWRTTPFKAGGDQSNGDGL